jgi:hypothetical protein
MTRTIPGRNFTQSNVQAGLIFTLCHRLDNPSIPKNSEQFARYLSQVASLRPISPSISKKFASEIRAIFPNSEPPPNKPINFNKNSERNTRYFSKIASLQAVYPPRGQ